MRTKQKLLSFLESNRGQNVSGEQIAGLLNISRTAVWKAINELKKDGYKINATTNKGYCLSTENDILSQEGIIAFLPPELHGREIAVYPSLDSTNILAKKMATEGASHGTVIIADHQTAGSGRYGRDFFSPAGCAIYMSIIFKHLPIPSKTPTLITAFAAVAVCEAIEKTCGVSPQIKWVNDLFLNGKKTCGISTEAITSLESGEIEWIVVGIGINVFPPAEEIPDELKNIMGTIFSQKPTITRNHLASEIITRMTCPHDNICEKELLQNYRNRLMLLGKKITVSAAGKTYNATALDIDDVGRLIIRDDYGSTRELSSGEVSVKCNDL
ncbi:MAG: biotin--[acetyl-CoA-carboxylase] ligase [Defluviitaleaceae bacterium]|nr:biotin--[acetyl-CoA-carboxylase] ligase [Defluviitaleaceae bacterium]